jgi:hypothetical protein
MHTEILVGRPEEKRKPERPRLRWENNINYPERNKMGGCELDLTASGWGP